jgi:uncharacterized membrane protein
MLAIVPGSYTWCMSKGRLEAFSDGVIAILITIMVLELKIPEGSDLHALRPMVPVFLAYVLSFVILGIYWNNHHHMLHATDRINGKILWANLHLLFWLSLIPAVTAWMGETSSAPVPTAVYGGVLLMAGFALLDSDNDHPRLCRTAFNARRRRGEGCEGQSVRGAVRRGNSAGVCESVDG